ncbi:amino acid adenylation domain-containing protein [Vibrio mangrovi]|uniref:Amino acid adenylation domain-containing protein n=1 Tax=Vibrio mangrovi TaxID=474394 RepID=A0ABU4I3B2_9VIBR|nr:non-ribosomal peptide synthetase [Vibrio mangrovi]MDW6002057.1 amino acid adenylation domain-containing protein [Vibrio mangrovi]
MSTNDDLRVSMDNLSDDEVVKLFELAKARGLKRKKKEKAPEIQPVTRSPEGEPLALAQRRIWFLSEMEQSASDAYIINGSFRLKGQLDIAILRETLDQMVSRHESLRTYFSRRDGQPLQQIVPADCGFLLDEVTEADLSEPYLPHFDLSTGPLARAELVHVRENEFVLRVALHHTIADGWSMSVLIQEVGTLYAALSQGKNNPLSPLPIQFADYAHWQQSFSESVIPRQRDYWVEQLRDAPEFLELRTDFPRPSVQDHAGAGLSFTLDPSLTASLKALCQRCDTTLFMTLFASWATLMSRLACQDDVVIGAPVAGRNRAELEGLIGMFVNTQALRVDLSEQPDTLALLAQVKDTALAAQSNQDIPFEQVVEAVVTGRNPAYTPLFQVIFALQNLPDSTLSLPGISLSPEEEPFKTAKFDLSLLLSESGDTLSGYLNYATALFEEATVERYLGYWIRLLEGMTTQPELPVTALPILGEDEYQAVIHEYNHTLYDYPSECGIHTLFSQQAAESPNATAVITDDGTWDYAALETHANALANRLQTLGIQPGQRIAIRLPRSAALIQAELAILKVGGVYVPLDPAAPPERQDYVLRDSGATILIGEPGAASTYPSLNVLEMSDALVNEFCDEQISVPVSGESPAYVMYTSGSTGNPKGVVIPHRAIARLVLNNGYMEVMPSDRVVLAANPAFDATTMEVWAPLLNGASVVVIPQDTLLDVHAFGHSLMMHQVNIMFLTVGLFNQYADDLKDVLSGLKYLLVGGDALDPMVMRRVLNNSRPEHLLNVYGPTETTTYALSFPIHDIPAEASGIPLGRPIGNTQIYLLNPQGQPVPQGVVGEIYIGGDGVAEGYLGQPELTAERFLPDPYALASGARMYKTGDLGYWRKDGNIEFVGRNDFQVKIRGFRIELGEIELALLSCGVDSAIVLARDDGSASKRLVAYFTRQERSVTAAELKSRLAERLPDYMVPVAYVELDKMPLTANGKVDRKALPEPDESAFVRQAFAAPEGEVESVLAHIWGTLLGIEQVGRHDNFFELGGQSLLAVQMIERLRQQGYQMVIRDLFARPTLAALAETLNHQPQGEQSDIPPNLIPSGCQYITPEMLPLVTLSQQEINVISQTVDGGVANIQDIYPLAPLQEGILFHHLLEEQGDPYITRFIQGFKHESDIDTFMEALQYVMQRHDILRTAVVWEGLDTPVQVVWREAPVILKTLEFEQDITVADALCQQFDPAHTRMDIQRAPMIEAYKVADPAEDRWLLCFLFHHLCNDHTTLELLVEEVQEYIAGRQADLPNPLPFRNFVAQTTLKADRESHLTYFRDLLGDLDEPCSPFGLQEQQESELAEGVHVAVDSHLAEQLRSLARQRGLSPAALFHLAWGLVVRSATGQEDVVFGTVLFGRMAGGEGADRVLGMFLNTLPLRLSLAGVSVESALTQTQTRLAELLEHEHTSLALAQQCSGLSNQTSLFSSLLNYRYQGSSTQDAEASEALGSVVFAAENTNYPLTVAVNDIVSGGFSLDIHVSRSIGGERVGAMLLAALNGLVSTLTQQPSEPVSQMNILPDSERERVLETFNQTEIPFPEYECIHALIEGQVVRNPAATAVVFEDQSLSYAELNRQANRLAHWLMSQGVRPDSRVAVCLERSCELVVSLLAILKAGGAYVPLDPGYPTERLEYMLSDSVPVVLITTDELASRLGQLPEATQFADMSAAQQPWAGYPDSNPNIPELTNRHLAYIIYTSGSTGLPKGVMNEHRGVVNRLYWMKEDYGFGPGDVVLQKTPFSFDVSVWEFFCPLWSGATLLMAKPEGHKDPDYLKDLITSQGVTILHFVPPMLQSFLEVVHAGDCNSLRLVFCSGEALPAEAIRKSYARLPHIELHNLYGPTEAAVDVTAWHCPRTLAGDRVSIGRPVANTRMYVLDGEGRPVAVGVEGELYIGGVQVARGYLNRDELTAERFVADPYSQETDAVMYRTGDVGCWLADGTIEYRGRNDDQVKIRGFRIELGEISSALQGCSSVKDGVVVARALGSGPDKQLVGYYTVEDGENCPDVESIKAELSERLPVHMVPVAYVLLDEMPLTPNGKVNRKALPEPDERSVVRREYEAPVGDAETQLADIWSSLLGVERVGRYDNFFELGGHSLLAVQMAERLRQRGYQLVIRHLFSRVTLAELAATLVVQDATAQLDIPPNLIPSGCQHITPEMLPLVTLSQQEINIISQTVDGGVANIQDIYPLAPLQEGILFHHLLEEQGDPYITRFVQSFRHEADIDTFMEALQHVMQRHDILRTAVVWEGLDTPVQVVWRDAPVTLKTLHFESGSHVAETLRQHFDPAHTRMDIQRAPMIEAYKVADPAEDRWLLCFLLHHLCNDHTTLELLEDEIRLYLTGREAELPNPLPFRNFVAQTTLKDDRESHLAYFRELLGDLDEPCAPFGFQEFSGDAHHIEATHLDIEERVSGEIRDQARRLGLSPAVLFHLAWGLVVRSATGQEDVVFGTVLFGRMAGGEGADRVLGMFLNTLPLRLSLAGTSVESALTQTQTRLAELLEHEHTSLALAQQCSGLSNQTPLFSSLLNYRYQGSSTQDAEASEALGSVVFAAENTNYPLTVAVNDIVSGGFSLDIHVSRSIGGERVGAMLLAALNGLVSTLTQQPSEPVSQMNILPDSERERVLETFNQTEIPFPEYECIHALIEGQVVRNPAATAVVFEDQSLSYAELNRQANRLAHWLMSQGVRPDSRVAVCLERSCELVVSLLAILKAGGAYVPLDPGYPTERLEYMLSDSVPVVLITTDELASRLGQLPEATQFADMSAAQQPWAGYPDSNPNIPELTNRHLAYIIYTSGSTGLPKGVMNEHRGVVNRLYWMKEDYGFGPGDVVLQKTPFSFDVSVWEFFCPLWSGATLLMAKPEGHKDPDYLKDLITSQGVTILHFVPPMLQSFLEVVHAGDCNSLRLVFCSGEALPAEAIRKSYARLPHIELHNLYGPTEAAVDVTAWHCPRTLAGDRVSIGRPVANTRMYVLDGEGRPVAVGVEGELYIGGVQVARGYLNRDELTAERFVADPYSQETDAVMYRTGDVGCWLADGTIEYRGRNDDQVKIRGFRIELGEISSALQGCSSVKDGVVVARALGSGPDKQLVGYYTVEDGENCPDVESIKAELSERLPVHMVPVAYVLLDEMPLTPNGKVNRKALPEPDEHSVVRREYEAPVGDAETQLANIWSSLLGVERVGRYDNFFELGGHSLLAVRMISRVRELLGCELTLATLFSHPALYEVAGTLSESEHPVLPAITPLAAGEAAPLSLAQKRLWFLAQMDAQATSAYTVPRSVRLQGKLDVDALQRALNQIVVRHATLRTHIEVVQGEPVQVVGASGSGFPLTYLDGEGIMDELAPFSPEFDLSQGPLVQGQLIRVSANEHWLRIVMHHIITDGWSMGIFTDELAALYEANCQGLDDPLPALSIQYGDYAAWQQMHLQGEVLQQQQQYWSEQLRDIPDCLTLPTDRPRPAHQDYHGASLPVSLSCELTEQLRQLSQHNGCTLYMTLLAGWSAVMSRLSHQDDVVIGSPVAGRTRTEVEGLIGMFVNSMAMRVQLSDDVDTQTLLAQVKDTALAAQAHQDIPFEQVVEAVAPVRSLSHAPIFQVVFALQNTPEHQVQLPDLTLEALVSDISTAQFDLSLEVHEGENGLAGYLTYATALFDEETVQRYLSYWINLLEGMVSQPELPIAALPILGETEQQQVIRELNQTNFDYPADCGIHTLFARQVARSPEQVAVVTDDGEWDYTSLDVRANALAFRLQSLGVEPGQRVAVRLPRSAALIVAELAILKCGGVYVPLDPNAPAERQQYVVDDCGATVLIAEAGVRQDNTAIRLLEMTPSLLEEERREPVSVVVGGDAPAYVMYTSGSTGQPKGVVVPHRAIARLVLNNGYMEVQPSDRVALAANPAFDATTLEVWAPLLNGAAVVVIEQDTLLNVQSFAQALENRQVSILWLTVGLFNQYAEGLKAVLPGLRYLLVGGDALDPAVIRRVLAESAPAHLLNGYGPTETTTFALTYEITAVSEDAASIPLGRPIGNTQVYLLNPQGQPVPQGVVGELYIGGDGVALGYLNQDELTAERFVADPYSAAADARMYRTGDLGYLRSDGTIEFVGRNDFQVKVRGFRIELGEIESALVSCGVESAVVIAQGDSASKRLVAYFTGGAGMSAGELKSRLSEHLPDYMVPVAYVTLAEIPLTANGKVDRRALPEPDEAAFVTREYEAPKNTMETTLAEIWSSLLGVERVGRQDDFFELGGHSLLAVRLISEIQHRLSIEVTITELFEHSVLSALAMKLAYIKLSAFASQDIEHVAQRLSKGKK